MTTVTEDVSLKGLRDALGLLKDREQVALRLLESSAKHSFDPDKELDWDAPLEEGGARLRLGPRRRRSCCNFLEDSRLRILCSELRDRARLRERDDVRPGRRARNQRICPR